MALDKINESIGRVAQLKPGVGKNQQVRASDFNTLIDFLNTLNTLGDYANDAAAEAAGVAIGELYRSTSTLKVRVA